MTHDEHVALTNDCDRQTDRHSSAPALDVWSTNIDLTIKPSRPHQRRVQNVDTICCSKNNDV